MHRRSRLILVTTQLLSIFLVLIILLFSGFSRGERIAADALTHLGKPYILGRKGPDAYDCSGLILDCFAKAGLTFEHSAKLIGTTTDYLTIEDPRLLCVGDVVCFDTVNDADPSDHVGIWLGANRFVHASSTYGKVVISTLEDYYLEHYTWGKRFLCPLY